MPTAALGRVPHGLLVAANKTVSGINTEFAQTIDQSCLNRFITAAEWDAQTLNERRLALLQEHPSTQYVDRGVIALDNVLVDHDGNDGKLIEDVGWFWDHAEQRHKIAHDYLFANYVTPDGKHYPLEFRRFNKRAKKVLLPGPPTIRPPRLAKIAAPATPEGFDDGTALAICWPIIFWPVASKPEWSAK